MVDFSFIVSLYVSDLPNVTISTSRRSGDDGSKGLDQGYLAGIGGRARNDERARESRLPERSRTVGAKALEIESACLLPRHQHGASNFQP